MSHFNLKSLAFYTVMIGSVLVLFKLVSAYGETSLKAPPPLAGVYEIPLKKLAGCDSEKVLLTLHQSGIYLTATLRLPQKQSIKRVEEKPELNGKWHNNNVQLTGLVEGTKFCKNHPQNKVYQVTIDGEFKKENFKGKFNLDGLNTPIEFTSKRQKLETETPSNH